MINFTQNLTSTCDKIKSSIKDIDLQSLLSKNSTSNTNNNDWDKENLFTQTLNTDRRYQPSMNGLSKKKFED